MNMTLGIVLIIGLGVGLGLPLFVILGALSAFLLLNSGLFGHWTDLSSIIEMTMSLAEKEVLLAIPFFVIAGAIMSEGDIAKRLIRVAREAFCWLPGGLAVSAVAACIFFAAISGSSPVTVIAIGTIMVPAMLKEGYRPSFAYGIVTAAGSLGILIPPSIPMIVYEIVDPTGFADPAGYALAPDHRPLGLADLFFAGLGPGFMIGGLLAAYAIFEGKRAKTPTKPIDLSALLLAIRDGVWALLLPVVILGGIYSGIFTPTQAAAVSVAYALIVELFIHRSLRLEDLPKILTENTILIGSLLIIIALAQGFNSYLKLAEIPKHAVELLVSLELSPIAFLLLVNILLLVVGCFMDILSAIIILVPLLAPIAFELGIHPLHLAIVFIVNLEIGYLTPPLGLNLFVASAIFRQTFGAMVRAIVPFLALMVVGLVLVTYVPMTSLGLVSALNERGLHVPFPEQRLPMRALRVDDPIRFLAGIASAEEDMAEEEEEDPDRVLTLDEILAREMANLQREDLRASVYDDLAALLRDYRRLLSNEVSLEGLAVFRELESYYAPQDELDEELPARGDAADPVTPDPATGPDDTPAAP